MKKLVIIFLALLVFNGSAFADWIFEDGTKEGIIYDFCVGKKHLFQEGVCYGYVLGLYEGIFYGAVITDSSTQRDKTSAALWRKKVMGIVQICVPEGATRKQYVDAVVKYFQKYPEKRRQEAYALVHAALKEAFPCKK